MACVISTARSALRARACNSVCARMCSSLDHLVQLGSTFNMEDLRKALGSAQSTPTAAAAATPSAQVRAHHNWDSAHAHALRCVGAQRHDASAHAPALQAANSEVGTVRPNAVYIVD